MSDADHEIEALPNGGFEDELLAELSQGHPLFGRSFRGAARSLARDDVLFEVDGTDWVIVHLTYKRPDTPPWPTFRSFPTQSVAEQWLADPDTPIG